VVFPAPANKMIYLQMPGGSDFGRRDRLARCDDERGGKTMNRYLWPLAPLAALAAVLLAPAVGRAAPTPPSMAWNPSTHDYGSVTPGDTASNTFTLTNSGGSATGALSVVLSGAGAAAYSVTSDGCTGTALGKGKSCDVTVQYAPTGSGSDSATLTANGKKSSASAGVDLTGSGSAGGPDLSLSPYTYQTATDQTGTKNYGYDFGVTAGRTQTFTVTNSGTGAATGLGAGLLVSGGDVNFVISEDTCTGAPLAAGAACTFDVTATAPTLCNGDGSFGPAPVSVDVQDNGSPYIFATVFGECL
jgi:centrosomal CEP192-like protein